MSDEQYLDEEVEEKLTVKIVSIEGALFDGYSSMNN